MNSPTKLPHTPAPDGETKTLTDLGAASEETRGRILQPMEFGVSFTSRDEAG